METILIAHNYTENSFSSMSVDFAHYLAELGYRVVFLSHQPFFEKSESRKIGKGVIIITSWPTKNRPRTFKDFIFFQKIYLKYRPKVIIGHFVGSNISAIVSKILSVWKVKVIVYYHTLSTATEIDNKKSIFIQRLLRRRKALFYKIFCDVLVCPSELSRLDLLRVFRVTKAKVILNPMRDRFNHNRGCSVLRIAYLGRLDNCKGVLPLVKSFIEHKDIYPESKLILSIAGSGYEEGLISKIIFNRADINLVGALAYDKIDDYLRNSYFCIIPSLSDNLPTVGLESLMNGTPLLISNLTGLSHYLTDLFGCLKFEPTVDGLTELLKRLEDEDYNYDLLRLQAREIYLKNFKTSSYCEQMLKLVSAPKPILKSRILL